MGAQPSRQTIRLRCDETSRSAVLDTNINTTPQAWARAATDFQAALASGGVLDDTTNIGSVTLEAAPYASRDAARVLSKTVAGGALDNTLTEATWADGSRQHAVFSFSSAEMNVVALNGATSVDLWLVISALTLSGDPIVYATGKLTISDPGTFAGAGAPPANPGAPITIDQADARYVPLAGRVWSPAVSSVGDGAPGSLEVLPTAALVLPALRTFYLAAADDLQDWLLLASTAATVAGQTQRPNDFDPAANAKVWIRKR